VSSAGYTEVDLARKGFFVRLPRWRHWGTSLIRRQITHVAADLTADAQTGTAYYVDRQAVIQGMPAEVHIRPGERAALSYFLNPLSDQMARAFVER
jgi:HlyD family secretion protein